MDLKSSRAAGVFTAKNAGNGATALPASTAPGNGGRTGKFDPSPPKLTRRPRYEARVRGGLGGAADTADNVLAADAAWASTTERR